MLQPAIRFIAAKSKSQSASIQLLCHVKPRVSVKREGIAAVTDEGIKLCVAAQPRNGESNKAVRDMIAQVLSVPKSNVEITKGMKSREKMVVVSGMGNESRTPEAEVERIKIILQQSVGLPTTP